MNQSVVTIVACPRCEEPRTSERGGVVLGGCGKCNGTGLVDARDVEATEGSA